MSCPVCGGLGLTDREVLWPELITEWALSPIEAAYINRQQGTRCVSCGANLRSQVLADAILSCLDQAAPLEVSLRATPLEILEINAAGDLHRYLAAAPSHVLAQYPEVDMMDLPYEGERFDLVVHSDTLEHVPHPVRALAECRRVLKPSGVLCYTVPSIVGRLSRRREGLPPSYHGTSVERPEDYLVVSEYGADMWIEPLLAGFGSVQIFARDFPAALALVARCRD